MYLIIDFETTCWEGRSGPDLNEIIEIGVVVCNDSYDRLSSWSSLVKPKITTRLSSFCRRLTSINQADLDMSPSLSSALNEFYGWFWYNFKQEPGNCIWYTWGGADLRSALFDCERNNLSFPFGEHRDLQRVYMIERKPQPGEGCSIEDVIKRENLGEVEDLHRAGPDAYAAAKIAKFITSLPSYDPAVSLGSEKVGS
jgi:inhibitor of KinA sporulation pathway (predicted exonuclease)